MTLSGLLQGVAVILALEGIAYAVAPGAMRRAVMTVAQMPERSLRTAGLAAAAFGVALAWLLQPG